MRRGLTSGPWAFGIATLLVVTACRNGGHVTAPAGRAQAGGETLPALAGGKEYTSAESHYTIRFPEGWTTAPGQRGTPAEHGGVMSVSKPEGNGFAVNASLSLEPLSAPTSVAALAESAARQLPEQVPGSAVLEQHHGRVNGREAAWFVWKQPIQAAAGPMEMRCLSFVTTAGQVTYLVTCCASSAQWETVRPTLEGICGSLRVEAGAGTLPPARTAETKAETLKAISAGKKCTDAEWHYTITFPDTWSTERRDQGFVKASSATTPGEAFVPEVIVTPEAMPVAMSTEGIAFVLMNRVKANAGTDYELLEEHHGRVNGRDAVWFVWKGKLTRNGQVLETKSLLLATTAGETDYTVLCAAPPEQFDGARPTFESICGSFTVNE
jgi:hypothetical protein